MKLLKADFDMYASRTLTTNVFDNSLYRQHICEQDLIQDNAHDQVGPHLALEVQTVLLQV